MLLLSVGMQQEHALPSAAGLRQKKQSSSRLYLQLLISIMQVVEITINHFVWFNISCSCPSVSVSLRSKKYTSDSPWDPTSSFPWLKSWHDIQTTRKKTSVRVPQHFRYSELDLGGPHYRTHPPILAFNQSYTQKPKMWKSITIWELLAVTLCCISL